MPIFSESNLAVFSMHDLDLSRTPMWSFVHTNLGDRSIPVPLAPTPSLANGIQLPFCWEKTRWFSTSSRRSRAGFTARRGKRPGTRAYESVRGRREISVPTATSSTGT